MLALAVRNDVIGGFYSGPRINVMTAGAPLAASPFIQFRTWIGEAEASEPNDPNAMVVATVAADGRPSLRVVLLKGTDDQGFVFYTNKESRKGDELAVNPFAALLFHWKSLGRQIRIEGRIEHVSDAEADAYFASRPRVSQLGAWASQQSRPLAKRTILEERLAEAESLYPDSVARPAYWSGYRLIPEGFEFWQDMPFRLHDRTVYRRSSEGTWEQGKLFP
jgi:pyridoxamine 5'-phosphate oxidase